MSRLAQIVALGACGVKLEGFSEPELLVPVPRGSSWETVRLRKQVVTADLGPNRMDERSGVIRFVGGAGVLLDRPAMAATLVTPAADHNGALDHAFLSAVGAGFARWRGDDSFHAGAFVAVGRAWALVGERYAGKSSLLAVLDARGHAVVTDDLLVVSHGSALAGPRCVDLRPTVGEVLGLRERTHPARDEERLRLRLGPVELEVPLRGWVFLSWGDEVAVRRLGAAERLRRLVDARMLTQPGSDPRQLLDLSGLPAWELLRPFDLGSMDETVDRLLEVTCR